MSDSAESPPLHPSALSQNAPCGVSTRQKNPHLRSVNAGFSSARSLPDTFCDSAPFAAGLSCVALPRASHAQANMDADKALVSSHTTGVILRHYRWETPGITLPEKRDIPDALRHYDVGIRPTGGGILFHAPGDFLFSLIAPNQDPRFPKPLSQKMQWLSVAMKIALDTVGLVTRPDTDVGRPVERQYCHTYPNPFELRYQNDKVCAFALRRFRHFFLIQGLLHLRPNAPAFPSLGEDYDSYFSEGLPLTPAQEMTLIVVFLEECHRLFEGPSWS